MQDDFMKPLTDTNRIRVFGFGLGGELKDNIQRGLFCNKRSIQKQNVRSKLSG